MRNPEDLITVTLTRDQWLTISRGLNEACRYQALPGEGWRGMNDYERNLYEHYRAVEDILTAILFPIGEE